MRVAPRLPLLFAVGLSACQDPPAPKAPVPAASAAPAPRLDRLVFEDPGADRAVDLEIRRLQAGQREAPGRLDGWILLGRAFVKKARQTPEPAFYENARACARRALALRPDYPLALDLEAMVLMNQHRFEAARRMVEGVLAKDPDDLLALGTLADAALELGDVSAAVQAADRMADLKPSLPAYARVAHLRWLFGDVEGAKAAYRAAIDAGHGASDAEPLAWVLSEAATLFLRAGDIEGARAGYARALTTSPGYPAARVGLARVDLAEGRFAAAADRLRDAYADSALAQTAWLWSQAARRAGRDQEAAQAWAKAHRLGAHGEGRVLAQMLAEADRDLEMARAAIDRERAHRGGYRTDDALALVALRQGDLRTARAALDRASAHGTPDPRLWAHEGLVLIAEGRPGAAAQALERAWRARSGLTPDLADEVARARAGLGG